MLEEFFGFICEFVGLPLIPLLLLVIVIILIFKD